MAPTQQTLPRVAWGSQQAALGTAGHDVSNGDIGSVTSQGISTLAARSVEFSHARVPSSSRSCQSPLSGAWGIPGAWGTHVAAPSGQRMEMPAGARTGTPIGLRSVTPGMSISVGRAGSLLGLRSMSPVDSGTKSPGPLPVPAVKIRGTLGGALEPALSSREIELSPRAKEKLSSSIGSPKPSTKLRSSRRSGGSRPSANQKLQSLVDASCGNEDLGKITTLLQYLQVSGVKFVKGSYLLKLRDRGQLLPRHQEIPASAFCPPEEVGVYAKACGYEGRPLIVSHPWWSFQHPDPSGVQLQQICTFLETKLSPTISAVTDRPVFIDYCSLPFPVVGDRLPDGTLDLITPRGLNEENRFQRAFRNMHILYAHDHTAVLRLDDKIPPQAPLCASYYSRGWCAFEWRISMTKKDPACSVSFADRRNPVSRPGCALMTPKEFKAELNRLRFTVKTDREKIAGLYAKVFAARTACTWSCLQGLTEKEMLYVARALPSYSRLQAIRLGNCIMSDEVADALAEVLNNGANPLLRVVKWCGGTESPLNYPHLFSALERRKILMDMNKETDH